MITFNEPREKETDFDKGFVRGQETERSRILELIEKMKDHCEYCRSVDGNVTIEDILAALKEDSV